jgi:mersacidin/lichenicidin family type 2 lantibiotic
MSHWNIIRAWKDPEYRHSLDEAERALLPDHPAGVIELTDADLDAIAGGWNSHSCQITPPILLSEHQLCRLAASAVPVAEVVSRP